jgi:hypothetical protein
MPSYYFIKLYDDILDDHKMGPLPDHLWRRAIEIFLLANRARNRDGVEEGYLPSLDEMAWTLRTTPEQLVAELEELHQATNKEERPIVQCMDGRWFVTQFAARQEAVSDAERKRRQRERDRVALYSSHDQCHEAGHEQGHEQCHAQSHDVSHERRHEAGHEQGNEVSHEQGHDVSHAAVTSCDTDLDIDLDIDLEPELDRVGEHIREDQKRVGANAPPPSPETNGKPPPTEHQAMFTALAQAYRINLDTLTRKQRGRLNADSKRAREAGITLAQVQAAGDHWWRTDWRGVNKRSPPTTSQFFQAIEVVTQTMQEDQLQELETW